MDFFFGAHKRCRDEKTFIRIFCWYFLSSFFYPTLKSFQIRMEKRTQLITHTNTFETSLNLFQYYFFFTSIRLCTRWVWLIILYESLERVWTIFTFTMHNRTYTHSGTYTATGSELYTEFVLLYYGCWTFRCSIMFFAGDFFYNFRLLIAFHDTVEKICVSSRIAQLSSFLVHTAQGNVLRCSIFILSQNEICRNSIFSFSSTFDSKRNSSPGNAFLNLCSQTSWHEFMYQLLEFFFICVRLQSKRKSSFFFLACSRKTIAKPTLNAAYSSITKTCRKP